MDGENRTRAHWPEAKKHGAWWTSGATFSDDSENRYRYTLSRNWPHQGETRMVNFLALNPSTADEREDDQTIKRCIGFAKAWGFAGFTMTNLFAFRAREPSVMEEVADPISEHNNDAIKTVAEAQFCSLTVACWGAFKDAGNRANEVKIMFKQMGRPLYAFKFTKEGHPRHPLYLPKSIERDDLLVL